MIIRIVYYCRRLSPIVYKDKHEKLHFGSCDHFVLILCSFNFTKSIVNSAITCEIQ